MKKVLGLIACLVILLVIIVAGSSSLFFNLGSTSSLVNVDVSSNASAILKTTGEQHKQLAENKKKQKLSWFNYELKDRFDRFTAMFEQSEQKMWQIFNQECELFENCQGLSELFFRYLQYKKSLISIDGSSPTDIQSFRARLDNLLMLREDFFSEPEIEILFARDQAWDEAALQRLAIRQDEYLSEDQKRILLEAHVEALPDALKKSLYPTLQLAKLASLRHPTSNQTSTYNEYAAEFGDEAAQRLIKLQQKRANWQQKLAEYQSEINTLSVQYSAEELNDKIQDLRNEMFSVNEQKRLQVLIR